MTIHHSRLIIKDLQLKAFLGVYDWEKHVEQTIMLDLELALDITLAAKQDDINQALDYTQLVALLKKVAKKKHYHLLETLTLAFKNALCETYHKTITHGCLTVNKPAALAEAKKTAILLEW